MLVDLIFKKIEVRRFPSRYQAYLLYVMKNLISCEEAFQNLKVSA